MARGSSRTSASIAAAVLALVPLGACSWVKAHVYQAVPVADAVGDSTTTLGGRKLHVYTSPRYTVFGPSALAVSTAAGALDRAYFQWYRYFGVSGARIALVLFDHPDSVAPADLGGLRRRGLLPVVYVRPKDARDVEHPSEDIPREAVWPISGAVSREMLGAYAAARRSRPLPLDSAGRDSLLDQFPEWYRAAVEGLLADPAAPDRAFDLLKDRADDLVPLANLLTRRRLDVGDTAQKPVRELMRVIDAEGLAFALYAADQEGALFVGRIANAFLEGGTAATALREARQLPHDVLDVERRWRKWIEDQS